MADTDPTAVTLFYSYAHEDEALRDELAGHLKILERRGLIRSWHDRRIAPGQDWAAEIDARLERAELVLLLVSMDFIQSDYIFGVELRRAMQRHADRACDVVPILVRAVNLEPEDAEDLPFLKLQGLPADLKPVTSWANRDEAWTHVAKGLRATVRQIRERRPPPMATPELRVAVRPPLPAAPPRQTDGALDAVVAGVLQQVDVAEQARGGHAVAGVQRPALTQAARALIDVPDARRVLWVDDRPEHNRAEMAVLAKLQIETVAVQSTAQALQRLAADAQAGEPFDLVLTDWSRPADEAPAALTLLAAMRAAGHAMPVAVYHGEFDPQRRAGRAARCRAAGALGEAVLPAELMRLVQQALAGVRASPAA